MLAVDDPSSWPPALVEAMETTNTVELLQAYEWMDDLIKEPRIIGLCRLVEEYAEHAGVVGFHCTKEISPDHYRSNGLRVLNIIEHHREFLHYISSVLKVEKSLYTRLENGLRAFRENHPGRREGMLWLCLSEALTIASGCDRFFKYYGGEAIYWPFERDEEISALLEGIGQPVVVKVIVPLKNLRIYRDSALGRSIVSICANRRNPEFNLEFPEGNITDSIPPSDVLDIFNAVEFREKVTKKWTGAV